MKPVLTGIPFIVYPVSDMARARSFYGSVLGLQETANWQDRWVEFDLGSSTLAITTFMEGAQPGAHGAAAAIESPDYDATVAWLKSQGVAFPLEPMDTGVCHFARFLDPDGNHLILHRAHPREHS